MRKSANGVQFLQDYAPSYKASKTLAVLKDLGFQCIDPIHQILLHLTIIHVLILDTKKDRFDGFRGHSRNRAVFFFFLKG